MVAGLGGGVPNGLKFSPTQTINYGREAGSAPNGLKFARAREV